MAEAIAAEGIRKDAALNGRVVVGSAGIFAAGRQDMSGNAKAALEALGIPYLQHKSQPLTAELGREADLILCMQQGHKDAVERMQPVALGKTFVLKEFAGLEGDITDPYGGDLDVYLDSAKDILEAVSKALSRIREQMLADDSQI